VEVDEGHVANVVEWLPILVTFLGFLLVALLFQLLFL